MTNEWKCPLCGKKLKDEWVGQYIAHEYFDCPKCKMNGNPKLWQALIQAKQDLKIVVDALKPFADRNNWDFEHCFIDAPQSLAEKALKHIEHKE